MHIQAAWPISVSVRIGEDHSKRMRDLAQNGIRYMELTASEIGDFEHYQEKSVEIFRTAREHGVKIRSVHLPFFPFEAMDPASADASVRAYFLEQQSEILKISAARGAEIAVVHPSAEPYEDAERSAYLERSIASMAALCEVAKKAGIRLALENLPRTCMMRDCREIETVKKALPDAFFCFDSNHSLIDQNTDIIAAMGERIIALHISDYDFINERHLFPGEGINDWNGIVRALQAVHYCGTWNYEVRDSAEKPAAAFQENYRMIFQTFKEGETR